MVDWQALTGLPAALAGWQALGLSLFVIPLVLMTVDTAGALRARFVHPTDLRLLSSDDFEVLVPIYGSMRFLENVAYLADYGSKVLICTTASETDEFYADLAKITAQYGFREFRGVVDSSNVAGKRNTGGTVRDRLVRDALAHVQAGNVVCIDADTVTDRPLDELVGCMLGCGYDMASVRLVPSNLTNWITRLQAHEYRVAMSLRKVAPWLVSGACHAARTVVHRDVMAQHSLFFQGNDVETGLIAHALGYRVGHIPFAVPTTVPDSVRAWMRQRLAWSGGEFRLFIVNVHLLRRHPLLWTYGAVIVILAAPFRWMTVLSPGWPLLAVVAWYLVYGAYVNWRTRDRWSFLIPLYTAFSSLVLTPLGVITYFRMAMKSKNFGRISLSSAVALTGPRSMSLAEAMAAARAAERRCDWPDAADRWCTALDLIGQAASLSMYESAERACELAQRIAQALVFAEAAVEELGAAADENTLIRLHERLAYFLVATDGDPDRVFAALKIAIDFGERRPPTAAFVQALLTAVGVLHEQGHDEARNELLARAISAADESGSVGLMRGGVLPWVAYLRLMTGDVTGCLEALLQAWALRPAADDPMSTVVVAALLVDVLRRLDRLNGLDAIAREGFDAIVRGGLTHTWMAACLRRNVAAALKDLGRYSDAASVLDAAPS